MTVPPPFASPTQPWLAWISGVIMLVGAEAQAQQPLSVPGVEIAQRVVADRGDSNSRPQAAYNNGRWLVAWNNRETKGSAHTGVQAAVLDAQGNRLTPFALELTAPALAFPLRAEEVAVAPLGDGFLVVWTVINTYNDAYDASVVGARVDADGHLTEGVRTLSGNLAISRFPQVASAGDRCLVVWTDDIQKDGTLELKGRILPAEGDLTHNPIIPVSPSGVAQDRAAVAFAGGAFLAAWTAAGPNEPRSVHGSVIDLTGTVSPAFPISSSPEDLYPRVARLGPNFIVTWHDFSRDFGSGVGEFGDLKAARINPAGQVLDAPALVIRNNPGNEPLFFSSVSGDENSALVTWMENSENSTTSRVIARRVRPDGTMEIPPGPPPATEAHQIYDAVSAPGAAGWLLAHTRDAAQTLNGQWPSEVYVRLLHDDGSPAGDEARVSGSANITQAIAMAPLDGGFVAVWQDDRHDRQSQWDIYASRFKSDGQPIDAAPMVVAESADDEGSPAVASVGDTWAVVWRKDATNDSAIQGRVMKGATPVSGVFLLDERMTDKFPKAPEIAAGPGGFFVVWIGADTAPGADPFEDIKGAGVSLTGEVAQPGGFLISAVADADQGAPEVASNGTSYLVVWRKDAGPATDNAILVRWFDSAALPSDGSAGYQIPSGGSGRAPDVAAYYSDYLVVWRSGRQFENVLGARVNGPGMVSPVQALFVPNGPSLKEPTVVGFGTGWLVGWFARGRLHAVQVHDTPGALTSGQWFEVPSSVPADSQNPDTLAVASLSDRVLFGVVDATEQRIAATLIFPGRTVPVLSVALKPSGELRIAAPTDPYFPLAPEKVEVTADGTHWQSLTSLPAGSWNAQADGSIEILPASAVLLARLRATLSTP